VIVTARSLSLSPIASAWHAITGSWVVHSRPISQSDEELIAGVTYAAKCPFSSFAADEVLMNEFKLATKGKRLAQIFGNWYGKLRLNGRRNQTR